jgi:phosphoribosylamine--glycine ligase
MKEGKTMTQGGRVLCVTALGTTLQEACDAAYQAAAKIHWGNEFYRTDIGSRALGISQ